MNDDPIHLHDYVNAECGFPSNYIIFRSVILKNFFGIKIRFLSKRI